MFELFALSLWLGFGVFLAFEGNYSYCPAFPERAGFTGNAYPYGYAYASVRLLDAH